MKWENGRKMQDDIEHIMAAYFEPTHIDTEHTNEELMEQQIQRKRLSTNQAR